MVKTKLVKRPELNIWQKLYVPELIRGIWITSGHFMKNFMLHLLHAFGFLKKIPASVTYQYPEEKSFVAPRARTRHRLTKREDGSTRCVACMMCETVCPAFCIYIVAEEHPDPNIEKRPKSFDIDLGKCVYCGYCVEACPEDAIRMDTQILDIAAYSRESMILNLEDLLKPSSPKEFTK